MLPKFDGEFASHASTYVGTGTRAIYVVTRIPGVAGKPQDAAIAIATHSAALIRPDCSRKDAVRIDADVRLHDGKGIARHR
jgi:hypothetical protein